MYLENRRRSHFSCALCRQTVPWGTVCAAACQIPRTTHGSASRTCCTGNTTGAFRRWSHSCRRTFGSVGRPRSGVCKHIRCIDEKKTNRNFVNTELINDGLDVLFQFRFGNTTDRHVLHQFVGADFCVGRQLREQRVQLQTVQTVDEILVGFELKWHGYIKNKCVLAIQYIKCVYCNQNTHQCPSPPIAVHSCSDSNKSWPHCSPRSCVDTPM